MRQQLEAIAKKAGELIKSIDPGGSHPTQKNDGSPVTHADLAADALIREALTQLAPLPIVSEESFDPNQIPSFERYFLVDPLDGTKEFLNKTRTYTVNIALIEHGVPVLGVIYAPETDEVYAGSMNADSSKSQVFRNQVLVPKTMAQEPLRAVCSASHADTQLSTFFARNHISAVERVGSSYKFCMLVDGRADLYVRFNQTHEWDTAAGQAIATAAGFQVLSLPGFNSLTYGKSGRINPGFIVSRDPNKLLV